MESESCCQDTGSHISSTHAVDRLRVIASQPSCHLFSNLPMISLILSDVLENETQFLENPKDIWEYISD